MALIDLTHALTKDTPVYPGDRPITIISTISDDIVSDTLHCSMHSGTHIDGPGHMIPNGRKLSEFPLEKFMGPTVVLDARNKPISIV